MENLIKPPYGANKKKKVVGRGQGCGRGTTSGRGNKGQNSRSGGGVRPGFEGGQMPLFRRIARRGFSNYPFKETSVAVNLDRIDAVFENGDTVSLETLVAKGLVKKAETSVKILGHGELTKKLKVEVSNVSAAAKEKIEKAGGSVSNGDVKQEESNGK